MTGCIARARLYCLRPQSRPAQAQDDYACVDDHVTSEPAFIRPGVIIGKQARSYFHAGTEKHPDCPGPSPVCRGKAYVMRGDKIFVAPAHAPGFVCAAFVSTKGSYTTGWLAADTVEAPPASPPRRFAAWLGKWRYLNSNITIKRGKTAGSLSVDGDSWSKRYMAVNTGGFSAEMAPKGNTLAFADNAGETVPIEQADKASCALTFALIHDVLVVNDLGYCGGAGVYFTGFYRRRR